MASKKLLVKKTTSAKAPAKKVLWKPIKGYEGMYQINKLGQIKSLDRVISRKDGRQQKIKSRLMSICKTGAGDRGTMLHKDGEQKWISVELANSILKSSPLEAGDRNIVCFVFLF
jgi:hypothetical protein